MTSLQSSYPLGSTLPNPGQYVVLSYNDSDDNSVPAPWRYNKQTCAIDFEFVNGFTASTDLDDIGGDDHYFQGQAMRASHNVLALGPKFIEWC
jgi:hypothetical protein